MRSAILLVVASTVALGQDDHAHTHARTAAAVGKVDFKSSVSAAARGSLQHGVALLHSFEYEDASTAFRDVQSKDPKFALGYWFDALTFRHPPWATENLTE